MNGAKIVGIIIIQAFVINSSNFNRFKVVRIKHTIKSKNIKQSLLIDKNTSNQNNKAIIFEYSVKRIKEKITALYSVIKPATNSDSASGKS